MFHSAVDASQQSWSSYEELTLLSLYRFFSKQFIQAYTPYQQLVKQYKVKASIQIEPITEEYINENSEVQEENIALLKNAIELWRSASQSSDAIAPILFHYSWHCFNSFFSYTFFRWNPRHSQSHGINIGHISDNIEDIQVTVSKNGLFSRLIDSWTCLGASLAFSQFLPILKDGRFTFKENELYFLKSSNSFRLIDLLRFNPVEDFERKYWNTYGRDELIQNVSFSNSMNMPTGILRSYLILFVASSLARYRPILWSSILAGESEGKAVFALAYRDALLKYTQFGVNSFSLLNQSSRFVQDIMHGKLTLKLLP